MPVTSNFSFPKLTEYLENIVKIKKWRLQALTNIESRYKNSIMTDRYLVIEY